MTYDPRLARTALVRRRPAPEPGTPEANPAATLIEPKVPGLPRSEQPSRWVALPAQPGADGRRTPARVVVPMPARTLVMRRVVGEADRYAGGTVRGSAWNSGYRWWVQVFAGVLLGIGGWALLIIGAAYTGLLK